MKLAIVLDNNVTKALVAPFEALAASGAFAGAVVFVGEKNKADTASITLPKRLLNHRKEVVAALKGPVRSLKRLRSNAEPRMDFYYNTLRDELRGFDAVFTQDVTRSLHTLAALKGELGFKIILRWWEVLPYKRLFSEKDKTIGEAALNKVDVFVPATMLAREALLLEGVSEGRICQIYPGIDTGAWMPARGPREAFGVPADRFGVLFAGRLVSHKGIYVLLWAALRLKAKGLLNGIVFIIAGGGRRDELMRLSREMGVDGAFVFPGHVPYQKMPELYNAADIFCLPSTMKECIQEQFGYVIMEALSCGLPVAASRVGAIPEVVGPAGLLTTPGDWNGLADAIESLMMDAKLRARLGALARQRAEAVFDVEKLSQKWRGLIERVA
ncbi:MAG: glycosyltransferase family 4 protein [Deltaproteobacteria bacterium]|nr:glycosyltransferase family 4 protein [Deltaproteobacteria bacterium]